MTLFAILGALLVFLALYLIVPPLLKQPTLTPAQKAQKHMSGVRSKLKKYKSELDAGTLSQQAYNSARQKLATQVIEEIEFPEKIKINTSPLRGRWAGWMLGLSIPVLAIGLYAQLGKPEFIDSTAGSMAQIPGNHGSGEVGSIEEMIAALKEKLKNQPDDAQGWYMLARSYMSQKEYPNAVEAMKKVVALKSDNANILMQYADALAMTNNGRVSGEAEKIIHQALALEPKHPEALWLAGIAAEEQGQHEKAIGHWEKALAEMQDDPESKQLLEKAIADARSKMSGGSSTVSDNTDAATEEAAAAPPQQEANAKASSITVEVSLAPELQEQAKPEDTVFIFARATAGPPMPLAAQRRQVKDLPFTVTLDDSQAMMPNRKLSNFDQVIVGARVSSSGEPTKQSGDLEGLSKPISPSQGITTAIVIDKVTALGNAQ